MENKFLKIGGGMIIAVLLIIVGFYSFSTVWIVRPQDVNVVTEKTKYQIEEPLKIKIENNLKKNICFSSCYPYYFEKKDGEWISYHYDNCPSSNLVENCLNSRQTKAFEIIIPHIKTGLYRLALPACLGCNLQEKFREDKWLYSNDFIVK